MRELLRDKPLFPVTLYQATPGGRQMIEEFEIGDTAKKQLLAVNDYSLTLNHKHVPEMRKYSGLTTNPLFLPTVANYYKGMIVRIPIHLGSLAESKGDTIVECLKNDTESANLLGSMTITTLIC